MDAIGNDCLEKGNTFILMTKSCSFQAAACCFLQRKFKQWWSSTISTIWTKRITTSHLKPLNTKTTTYDVGYPSPGLRQTQKCGGVKPVNGILAPSLETRDTCTYLSPVIRTRNKCIWYVPQTPNKTPLLVGYSHIVEVRPYLHTKSKGTLKVP